MIKKLFFLGLLVCPAWPAVAQDDVIRVKRTDLPVKEEVSEMAPLEVKTRDLKDDNDRQNVNSGLVFEQEPSGNMVVRLLDDNNDTEESVTIPATDSLGYYPLKKFLKDIDADLQPKWNKYEQAMKAKEKAYLSGKEIELKYIPIAQMQGVNAVLEFGCRPWFWTWNDGKNAKVRCDLFVRIRPKRGKVTERCFRWEHTGPVFTWMRNCLKYQLLLKKK